MTDPYRDNAHDGDRAEFLNDERRDEFDTTYDADSIRDADAPVTEVIDARSNGNGGTEYLSGDRTAYDGTGTYEGDSYRAEGTYSHSDAQVTDAQYGQPTYRDDADPLQPVPSYSTADSYTTSATYAGADSGNDTKEVAKQEAAAVKDQAVASGTQVAQTAKSEAAGVAQEAKYQSQHLMRTGLAEVRSQAGTQQQRIAETVAGIAGELQTMARNSEQNGHATQLVGDLGQRADGIARWLGDRGPEDVLEDVRRYARRNPWTFLAVCAGAGVVASRLVRGLQADASDDNSSRQLTTGYYQAQSYRQGYDYPQQGYTTTQGYAGTQGYTNTQGYADPQGYGQTGYAGGDVQR